jgi:Uncharacterized protein conserved in bacteria (DUF2171)
MATNTFDIHEGMEVFGSDGQKIGKVDEVHANADAAAETGAQAMSSADESSTYNADRSDFGAADNLVVDRVSTNDSSGSAHDVTRDPTEMRQEYGTAATATRTRGDTGYFKVREGGILGLGARDLFIPFTAVETVAADGVVTLSYTKDDVGNRFDHEPDESDDSNAPDMPIV